MIYNLVLNLNFWSALSGLFGTVLIFFFGMPPRIDQEGHSFLLLEGDNESEKKKAKKYKLISYFGLIFIAISFLMQLVNVIFNFG
jgi:hypothetical protein